MTCGKIPPSSLIWSGDTDHPVVCFQTGDVSNPRMGIFSGCVFRLSVFHFRGVTLDSTHLTTAAVLSRYTVIWNSLHFDGEKAFSSISIYGTDFQPFTLTSPNITSFPRRIDPNQRFFTILDRRKPRVPACWAAEILRAFLSLLLCSYVLYKYQDYPGR